MPQKSSLSCLPTIWHGRSAYVLENSAIRLVTLTGGGHIAELRFVDASPFSHLSPLWVPPWRTMEPYNYREELHFRSYGSLLEGKLLSGIAGHNICLDYFGPPTQAETRQRLSQHGEAPMLKWRKTESRTDRQKTSLTLTTRLPAAGLIFSRNLRLQRGSPVVYFTETVTNENRKDHFFHWVQHVTLGPPFISARDSRIALPGTKGLTFPHPYNGKNSLLATNRIFRWPLAPALKGGTVDLRRTLLRTGTGIVAGVLLNPRSKLGFVAAINLRHRLLLAYCFNRSDFPWVAVWEENRAIEGPPWKKRTETRGLEFGTTALPVQRHENVSMGNLFGVPTCASVPARGRKTVRYLAFLAQIPRELTEIRNIGIDGEEIVVRGKNNEPAVRLSASGLSSFSLFS
ncbi:MAG: hypothetical protein EPN47_10455 [Acidobacteria bacterium]|nr:MAG: hypothetical protein EPN47_10455 [Acidobacteriota bacterium]